MKTPTFINILLAIVLVVAACGKQNNLTSTQSELAAKTKSNIVIGPQPPPVFLFWAKGPAQPLPSTGLLGRKAPFAFSIGGKGYLGGGVLVDNGGVESPATDVWAYDTVSLAWSQLANFRGDVRTGAASYAVSGKGYVCTGSTWQGLNSSKQNWQYDPVTNTWTRKTDFPGPARTQALGNALNGMGYVGTGRRDQSTDDVYADWYQYNPASDSWTKKANVPRARWSGVSFASSNRIFVCGGTDVIGAGGTISDMWSYEPSGNSWIPRTALPAPRTDAVGVSLPQSGVLVSGLYNGFTQYDVWRYSFANNTWTSVLHMPGVRMQAGGFSIGGTVYVAGGQGKMNDSKTILHDFWALALEY